MTYQVTHVLTCDVCLRPIDGPTERGYWNTGQPPQLPAMAVHQWRYYQTPYDLCGQCAEPMRALFDKLYTAALATREADKAVSEGRA